MPHDQHTPILIVGGGTGGVAAALAVAGRGIDCVLTEPTHWVGGQLTSQAVPPDENRWIEGLDGVQSATASYLDFRRRVRQWYRDHRPLTAAARADARLNPGNGWVSHLCFEPAVGHAVLLDLLAPHLASGRITLWLHHAPVAADVERDKVRSVTLQHVRTGERVTVTADYVVDATELGDLYPLTGAEHAIGAEHRDDHGELHGRPDHADPLDQQAISWCFAMEHRPGEDHTTDRPAGYATWRSFVPPLTPPWPGPLFSWVICDEHDRPRTLGMTPWPDEPPENQWELWRYRRIVDRSIYADPAAVSAASGGDVSLVNWVQMDYFNRPTLGVPPEEQALAFADALDQSRCFFYWMQTEAPRHDGGTGYPGLRLRGDELGTDDGFALAPYIREPRRLTARSVLTEAHLGAQQRRAAGHKDHPDLGVPLAEPVADSVGIGHYRLDLHPSTAGRNSIYVEAAPFQIPLGSLVPVRLTNLLAGGKGFGVTHITNGCTRLHPIEWNVGESAGHLAAHVYATGRTPAQLAENPAASAEFRTQLAAAGVALDWPAAWRT
jgi:hypothetical protein